MRTALDGYDGSGATTRKVVLFTAGCGQRQEPGPKGARAAAGAMQSADKLAPR